MNFEDEPLMSCRVCHFPRGLGKNKWEKFHALEFAAKLPSNVVFLAGWENLPSLLMLQTEKKIKKEKCGELLVAPRQFG